MSLTVPTVRVAHQSSLVFDGVAVRGGDDHHDVEFVADRAAVAVAGGYLHRDRPTSAAAGMPEKARVVAAKVSHVGSGLPSAFVAM